MPGALRPRTRGGCSLVSHMRPIASSGPRNAPATSSDCRRPKEAPRSSGGARSAISASRGAPRMPLPMRSTKRAANTQPTVCASGNTGFVKAASPYPIVASSLRFPSRSDNAPENTFVIAALASATPSMSPTESVEAPSAVTR